MPSNNDRFSLADETFDWEDDVDAGTSADRDAEEIDRSERKRTFLIAGQGALAGGVVVGLLATVVTLALASTSAAPRPVGPASHLKASPKPVVVGPAKHPHPAPAVRHRAEPTPKTQHRSAPPKHHQARRHHHPAPPVRKPRHATQYRK